MEHLTLVNSFKSPLSLDGWLKWNQEMWGVEPKRVVYSPKGKELPRLEGVLYLDKRGRVRMPKRNPYLPFSFYPTPTERKDRLYRQWLDVCELFAAELKQRGIKGVIKLPPGLIDGRPFQWHGFKTDLRYTFIGKLPLDEKSLDSSVRNKIRKAEKNNYIVKRSTNWQVIESCFKDTEEIKNFSHNTDEKSLQRCQQLMGNDYFRGYVASNSDGAPVSASIRLAIPQGSVIAWSHGTIKGEQNSGVTQLMYTKAMEDAYTAGAKYIDLTGANIPSVAQAKASWGFPLVPYLTIQKVDYRYLARTTINLSKDIIRH